MNRKIEYTIYRSHVGRYPGEEFMGKITEIIPENPAEKVYTKVLEVKIELDSGQKPNPGLNMVQSLCIVNETFLPFR